LIDPSCRRYCWWNIPKGGSTSRDRNNDEPEDVVHASPAISSVAPSEEGSIVGVKVAVSDSTTKIVQEAAKGLVTPSPLRISTSQMGNEIITDKISEKKRLSMRERRRKWIARRKAKKQERQSHKKHAMKLKVSMIRHFFVWCMHSSLIHSNTHYYDSRIATISILDARSSTLDLDSSLQHSINSSPKKPSFPP
jgi:hypothetical protein